MKLENLERVVELNDKLSRVNTLISDFEKSSSVSIHGSTGVNNALHLNGIKTGYLMADRFKELDEELTTALTSELIEYRKQLIKSMQELGVKT